SRRAPLGGVPLLGWCVAMGLNFLLEDGEEGATNRLGAGRGDTEGRRLGLPDDLADGPEVEVVFGAGLSHADLAGADATADLGPEFHVGEHSCLPQSAFRATL